MNKKIIALEGMKKKEQKLIEELDKAVKHNRNATILKRDDCKIIVDCIKDLQEQVYEYEQLQNIQNKREYRKRYIEDRRKEESNLLSPDFDEVYKRYYEQKDKIDTVVDDMKHFHLIYNEDGKLISSDKSIYAKIRYFINKLEGTIPTTMTPFEYGMWERENRKNEDINEEESRKIIQRDVRD